MKHDHIIAGILLCIICTTASATIPEGYYSSLVGKNEGALRDAIEALAKDHSQVSYGSDTWTAFIVTDVIEVRGRKAWRDMYSNNLVFLPGHDAENIEHTVANSWWGKTKNAAYCDLFHLNPSDQMANGKKSNYPPGLVAEPTLLDNGLTLVGTPCAGYGGGAPNVFEPADEYKGDFARAFFYIFTAYPEIGWLDDYAYMFELNGGKAELKQWAYEMLLKWDECDPVDSREKARNEAIYQLQGNRNPFIDLEYVASLCFEEGIDMVLNINERKVIDRPAAPEFNTARMVNHNCYAGRYWDSTLFPVSGDGQLWISYDDAPFDIYDGAIEIPQASADGQTHKIAAYVENPEITHMGEALRSSTSYLEVRASNPTVTDWSIARWASVTNTADVDTDNYYILLSANTLHAMGVNGGLSTKFMPSAGFVEFSPDSIHVTELPADAAIVKFGRSGSDSHPRTLGVYDVKGNFKGYWNATAKNSMKLDVNQATPATLDVDPTGNIAFTFSQFGRLQFNKAQPRFLNYESNQGAVKLYKFLDFNAGSGINAAKDSWQTPVVVDGRDILVPDGGAVYDLGGRRISGQGVGPGIYIVTAPGLSATKVIIR